MFKSIRKDLISCKFLIQFSFLVSFFKGISTFVVYLMLKSFLEKNISDTI